MTDEYVDFGDVSRQQLGEQCQYGSRYIDGYLDGWPNLGKGLRFTGFDSNGRVNNYHEMKIHRDDVDEFVRRVKACQNGEGNGISCPSCGEPLYDVTDDWEKTGYECRACDYKGWGA